MLDMGFLPEIRRILGYLPARRQTLLFSATMPPPIAALAKEMMRDAVAIQMQRVAAPASGITQAVYPVEQGLKAALLSHLLLHGAMTQALVFTRTKHRANRLAEALVRSGVRAERIHGNRSQAQRTAALAGFKSGAFPVLVATDIAARGIDVDALGHVVNFDVPQAPEDYIHRIGRTGRADAVGEAFTLLSPDEEPLMRDIERAVGKRLPRVTVPDFDYNARPAGKLEIPLAQRIAEIRARKREERARQAINAARRANAQRTGSQRSASPANPNGRPAGPRPPSAAGRPPRSGHGGAPRRPSHDKDRRGR
jgi:ATP-dependent RNA helicase RhlE